MKILSVYAIVLSLFARLTHESQKCVPLSGSPLELCKAAGYNTTYPIPDRITLSKRAQSRIQGYIAYSLGVLKNCSVAQMGEAVFCSEFAPNCRRQDTTPFLPCRRVCSEYLKRCEGRADQYWLEFSVSTCTLLPNATAESGKCFEPPGFHQYHNASTKGLLEGECTPVILPICNGVGYNHTIISMATQLSLYRTLYGKQFTNTTADQEPQPSAFIYWLQKLLDVHPKCSFYLRQLFCANHFAPCFPGEGFALYTLCRPVCQKIVNLCPGLLKTELIQFVTDCDITTALGNTSHGFCKQTQWPPPVKWMRWFQDLPTPPSTILPPYTVVQPAPTVEVQVIAIAVVVPIILFALIILAILGWRQHKLPTFCLRGKDKEDLVPPPFVVEGAGL